MKAKTMKEAAQAEAEAKRAATQRLLVVFSAHLTLLECTLAADICLSVHLSVKRVYCAKTK